MNRKLMTNAMSITLLMGCITTAQAGLFDKIKDKVKGKSKEKAEQVVSDKDVPEAESSLSLEGGPSEALRSFTKCDSLKPENITLGYYDNYTFQQGFSKEKRTGLVNRTKGNISNGCILPSMQPRQVVYMEVDTQAYEQLGSSNDWSMQCVKSANPSEGAVGESEPKTEYPYKVNFLSGKDMLLHCGHDEKHANECAEGSNSSRSSKWKSKLDEQGKTMLSVMANTSTLAPKEGEKLYCQYYNKQTRTSLFAFEYLRTRG